MFGDLRIRCFAGDFRDLYGSSPWSIELLDDHAGHGNWMILGGKKSTTWEDQ